MKKILLLLLMALLPMTVLMTITSCGDDDGDIVQTPSNDNDNNANDNGDNSGNDNSGQQTPEIVVTVDANGNADGGHRFTKIDENNFYIDDIKYTVQDGDLVVTGWDKDLFNGVATIISKLKYSGRTMNVVAIGRAAFFGCGSMTSVTIPSSVTSIGDYAFDQCDNLTSIIIPNSVTSIGRDVFYGCDILTSVTIGSGLASISSETFYCCGSLVSITIPEGVTSIGYGTFFQCGSLASVTIPSSVTSIGGDAFFECGSLKDVYCYATNPPSTGKTIFNNAPISSATLHVPAGSLESYRNTNPWSNFGTIVAIE